MSYITENELHTFGFQDAYVEHFELTENQMDIALEGVIVRDENKNNSQYMDSYAKHFTLQLMGMRIIKAYKEGFKYYDANDVLLREVPNEEMEVESFIKLFKSLEQPYFYGVNRLEDDAAGKFVYEFGVEERQAMEAGNTYWFTAVFDKSVAAWEGYMNRVQS